MRATAPRNLSTNVILASSSSRRTLHQDTSLIGVELHAIRRSSALVVNHTNPGALSSRRFRKPPSCGDFLGFFGRIRRPKTVFPHVPDGERPLLKLQM
jgi:hypothetical protein